MSISTAFSPYYSEPIQSPYFLLPDPSLLDDVETYKPPPNSIKQIYGKVEHMSDRKQADFLLRLMAHSNCKPDFAAMATALGLPGEGAVYVLLAPPHIPNQTFIVYEKEVSHSQRRYRKQRFKSLCEVNNFKFEDDRLEATDSLPDFDKAALNDGTAEDGSIDSPSLAIPASEPKRVYQRKPKVAQLPQVEGELWSEDSSIDNSKPAVLASKPKRVYKRKPKPNPPTKAECEQLSGPSDIDNGKPVAPAPKPKRVYKRKQKDTSDPKTEGECSQSIQR